MSGGLFECARRALKSCRDPTGTLESALGLVLVIVAAKSGELGTTRRSTLHIGLPAVMFFTPSSDVGPPNIHTTDRTSKTISLGQSSFCLFRAVTRTRRIVSGAHAPSIVSHVKSGSMSYTGSQSKGVFFESRLMSLLEGMAPDQHSLARDGMD
jgi:hypothetical protein